MRFNKNLLLSLLICVMAFTALQAEAQGKGQKTPPAPAQLIKRTIIKREMGRLGYGGTVTLLGAPQGTITIEGWARSEVELTADVELQAETEADLDRLALVNGFLFEETPNHIRILSVGMHDQKYMRRAAKGFPKKLLALPWRIDYRIRVPEMCDLEINAGRGPITLGGVEGAVVLTATESVAQLSLKAGVVNATVGLGKLDVKIPVRSWRGGGADIKLAAGEMTVELPPGFNGDIDVDILRNGKIDDSYGDLQPRQRNSITPQMMRARAGAGGAVFKFTVADGTITFKKH